MIIFLVRIVNGWLTGPCLHLAWFLESQRAHLRNEARGTEQFDNSMPWTSVQSSYWCKLGLQKVSFPMTFCSVRNSQWKAPKAKNTQDWEETRARDRQNYKVQTQEFPQTSRGMDSKLKQQRKKCSNKYSSERDTESWSNWSIRHWPEYSLSWEGGPHSCFLGRHCGRCLRGP